MKICLNNIIQSNSHPFVSCLSNQSLSKRPKSLPRSPYVQSLFLSNRGDKQNGNDMVTESAVHAFLERFRKLKRAMFFKLLWHTEDRQSCDLSNFADILFPLQFSPTFQDDRKTKTPYDLNILNNQRLKSGKTAGQ